MLTRPLRLAVAVACFLAVFVPRPVGALHPDYVNGEKAYLAKNWAGALALLQPHWRRGHRSAGAAYYIGSSKCRLSAPKAGRNWLNHALRSFSPMGAAQRSTIRAALNACPLAKSPPVVIAQSAFGWSGELLYFGASATAPARPVTLVQPIPADKLAERQVTLGDIAGRDRLAGQLKATIDAALAGQSLCTFVQPVQVTASGRFIIVTRVLAGRPLLDGWTSKLEAYLQDLEAKTGARPPDRYITLYLARCPEDASRMAQAVHGLDIDLTQAFGYSVDDDFSLMAQWAGEPATGDSYTMRTLRHELAHLVLRHGFGDVPRWLDEGVAQYMGVLIAGRAAAATTVLPPAWGSLPPLDAVVGPRFEAAELPDAATPACRPISQLMMQADVARMFVAHVDRERGRLRTLIDELRKLEPSDGDALPSDVAVVERVLGRSLAALDADYKASATVRQDAASAALFTTAADDTTCTADR